MSTVKIVEELSTRGKYDIIVAGGGVAGVAAALTARARGKSVLLIEKSNILGGLATLGLVNFFVPMCNGRGKQIVFGLADKWFHDCIKYGFDSVPDEWKNGEPESPTTERMLTEYSPYIFAFQLTEEIKKAGVDLLYDCVVSQPVMNKNVCKGVVTESKSGREYYECSVVIDVTGDSDIMRRAGVPTVKGKNYYMYQAKQITLDSCQNAVKNRDIRYAMTGVYGGRISLYGDGQPADKPLWSGVTVEEVTDYLIDNQLCMLDKLKDDDRRSREVVSVPLMPNFRTTCRIDGDYTLHEQDRYKHFDDSVCAINDFDRRDFLYEVPLRCLVKSGFPNIITAGRSASGEGYAWDVLRVIPPAILTGQAAAEASVLAIESGCGVSEVDIKELQRRLEQDDNIMIHFPDELVPDDRDTVVVANEGHI